MEPVIIYTFLLGLFMGRYTNIILNIVFFVAVISYFENPEFYTYDNFIIMKDLTLNLTKKILN